MSINHEDDSLREENEDIFKHIEYELRNGNSIENVSMLNTKSVTIPKDFNKSNSLLLLGNIHIILGSSGVRVNVTGDKNWRKFFSVKNIYVTSNGTINEILALWNEKETLLTAVRDNHGAGSGEGILKIFVSSDYGMTWEVKRCFYYMPEDVCEASGKTNKRKCISPSQWMDILEEYPYNDESKKFEYENCHNASLIVHGKK